MHIFLIVAAVLVSVVAVLAIVIAMRPSTFRIERSATIHAPADVVFPLINDFHLWGQWSPWENVDPEMKRTYDGPSAGVGTIYAWAGNKNIGEGRMTIVESTPNSHVGIKLEFFKPFAATNQANFMLAPTGGGTSVTWRMDGCYNTMTKAMSLFMSMDKMVGKSFEEGLADLDKVARSKAC